MLILQLVGNRLRLNAVFVALRADILVCRVDGGNSLIAGGVYFLREPARAATKLLAHAGEALQVGNRPLRDAGSHAGRRIGNLHLRTIGRLQIGYGRLLHLVGNVFHLIGKRNVSTGLHGTAAAVPAEASPAAAPDGAKDKTANQTAKAGTHAAKTAAGLDHRRQIHFSHANPPFYVHLQQAVPARRSVRLSSAAAARPPCTEARQARRLKSACHWR